MPVRTGDPDFFHAHLILIYEQKEFIDFAEDEKQIGCTEDIVSGARLATTDLEAFKDKHDLIGPIAGNVMKVTDNGVVTDEILCRITVCQGEPFPVPLEGVNDDCD